MIRFSPAAVLPKIANAAGSNLRYAHIGYRSIVTRTNVTATSQTAGFGIVGVANPLTFERWKPTALPATITVDAGNVTDVDYVGIASHTFGINRCVISIQYSPDNTNWTQIAELSPGDQKPLMAIFQKTSARYWRLVITGQSVPSLGVLFIGEALVMQRGLYGGHTPITMGRNTRRIVNRTEGGQYAGVSIINEGVEGAFEWDNLTAQWYRDNFEPFVIAARSMPFFISWRYETYPTEIGYVWVRGDIRPQNTGVRDLMSVSMNVDGYSDE